MENNQTAAVVPQNNQSPATTEQPNSMQVFASQMNFEAAQRMANALASSTIVPVQFQKAKTPEAVANCIIALEMANRIGASPLQVMQNLYVVYGNVGWSSKFLIASLNTCGRFTPLQYEQHDEFTDNWRVRAWAIDKQTGAALCGTWVTMQMVKAEGWDKKQGSKWLTMPEQMFRYRAAAFFQRAYAPEVSMGMQTAEEIEDIGYNYEDITPRSSSVKPFDMADIKTEADVNKALLRGYISQEEAENLKEVIVKAKAAEAITNTAGKLFPDIPEKPIKRDDDH